MTTGNAQAVEPVYVIGQEPTKKGIVGGRQKSGKR